MIRDDAAPRFETICVVGSSLEVRFSEEPDLSLLDAVLQIDGAPVSWSLGADRYSVISEALAPSSHTLEVLAGQALDLAGQALSAGTTETFTAGTTTGVFSAPVPGQVATTSIAGRVVEIGFHGRPIDRETGLLYFRHRYYAPEMGRFVTTDPLGYADGPSLYAFAMYSPYDYGDPMGLLSWGEVGAFAKSAVVAGAVTAGAVVAGAAAVSASLVSAPFVAAVGAAVGVGMVANAAINHFRQGLDHGRQMNALQALALGAGDASGLVGGYEAYTGRETYTGRKLTGEERASRAGEIVGGAVGAGIGSAVASSVSGRLLRTPCRIFNCFTAGTLILTESGPRAIEEIAVGDRVWAYDEVTGGRQLAEVVNLFERTAEEVWTLRINGESIETTEEHPFYVEEKGWVEARDLAVGDWLVTYEGERLRLEGLERSSREVQVYNFEVAGLHNYFVGGERVLVHNCGGAEGINVKQARSVHSGRPRQAQHLLPANVIPLRARGNLNRASSQGVIFVDGAGNAFPTPPGGRITGSPDGRWVQARDAAGNPTGTRIDGPHKPASHPDPRAQRDHAHVPGVTNVDGTPWLPIRERE